MGWDISAYTHTYARVYIHGYSTSNPGVLGLAPVCLLEAEQVGEEAWGTCRTRL